MSNKTYLSTEGFRNNSWIAQCHAAPDSWSKQGPEAISRGLQDQKDALKRAQTSRAVPSAQSAAPTAPQVRLLPYTPFPVNSCPLVAARCKGMQTALMSLAVYLLLLLEVLLPFHSTPSSTLALGPITHIKPCKRLSCKVFWLQGVHRCCLSFSQPEKHDNYPLHC